MANKFRCSAPRQNGKLSRNSGNLGLPAETIKAGSTSPARWLGRKHMRKLILALAVLALAPRPGVAQDAKATLDAVAKAMGDVKTLQITGSGTVYSFGQ